MANAEILAVIFDFDDTLAPESTTQFLESRGVNSKEFWDKSVRKLLGEGYDPALAWLTLFLENVGEGKPLGPITNDDLRAFGAEVDDHFFPGVPEVFDDLKEIVSKSEAPDISIEFYIISGGLREILRTTKIAKYFSGIYASELAGNGESEVLSRIKRAITFTEKTRYIYEINKGISQAESEKNAFLVNRDVKERRIPGKNMIYLGDGLTDIPAFSLIEKTLGGYAIGVFDRKRKDKGKTAMYELFAPGRTRGIYAPRYRDGDDLGDVLRLAIEKRLADIELDRKRAYGDG